mmetsp:Transcript_18000/g.43732  ORF Transcript_18000/g.43732 Transcript_18000/m.43732 type:complete len:241 (+) Transcript_18000:3051-3773(+)
MRHGEAPCLDICQLQLDLGAAHAKHVCAEIDNGRLTRLLHNRRRAAHVCYLHNGRNVVGVLGDQNVDIARISLVPVQGVAGVVDENELTRLAKVCLHKHASERPIGGDVRPNLYGVAKGPAIHKGESDHASIGVEKKRLSLPERVGVAALPFLGVQHKGDDEDHDGEGEEGYLDSLATRSWREEELGRLTPSNTPQPCDVDGDGAVHPPCPHVDKVETEQENEQKWPKGGSQLPRTVCSR